jgi:hypothetical protein
VRSIQDRRSGLRCLALPHCEEWSPEAAIHGRTFRMKHGFE